MSLTFGKRRRRWPKTVASILVLVAVGVAAAGVVVFVVGRHDSTPPLPVAEAHTFLRAWQSGDVPTMAALIDGPPGDLQTRATSLTRAVPSNRATYTPTGVTWVAKAGGDADASYHANVDLGFGSMSWDGTMRLHQIATTNAREKVWRIVWKPDLFYPGLTADEHLSERMSWPARGSIFAADGSVLAGPRTAITIGLEPDHITNLDDVKAKLKQYADVDPTAVDVALHQSWVKPNLFVPVTSVADDVRYTQTIRPSLYPVGGVEFQRTTAVISSSNILASQIVGTTGPITAQRLQQLGPPYRAGDQVGLSGVQAAFEKRLAGTPTASVFVVAGDRVVRMIKKFPGQPARSVRLTIDRRIQSAAEAALAGVPLPAALVAIDPATGGIRAVVSKPDGGFNRALDGAYPPGSTFKVITSTALLSAGRTWATPAPCPSTLKIDGRTFRNFEGEANGALDLARAFAISCNNAFIGLGDQLPANALTQAAALYGFNTKWSLPIPSAAGTFPTPKDGAERAASAIGQGRILASPAQMASVAAAVAAGQWHAPTLTSIPVVAGPKVAPLDPSVVAALRGFMAGVVGPGGTAASAGLPPGTIGKTGTAEFGNANPPATHAWFIGYRNNLAFAVIVEGGGVGGQVAAPLAAKFLNALG
jgi:cell division protein FtsI/penicillin-binding protein 2